MLAVSVSVHSKNECGSSYLHFAVDSELEAAAGSSSTADRSAPTGRGLQLVRIGGIKQEELYDNSSAFDEPARAAGMVLCTRPGRKDGKETAAEPSAFDNLAVEGVQ